MGVECYFFVACCYCAFDMLATVDVYLSRSDWYCKRQNTEHVFIFTLHDNVAWMCLIFFFLKSIQWHGMYNSICTHTGTHFDLIDSSSFMCLCMKYICVNENYHALIYRHSFAFPFYLLSILTLFHWCVNNEIILWAKNAMGWCSSKKYLVSIIYILHLYVFVY